MAAGRLQGPLLCDFLAPVLLRRPSSTAKRTAFSTSKALQRPHRSQCFSTSVQCLRTLKRPAIAQGPITRRGYNRDLSASINANALQKEYNEALGSGTSVPSEAQVLRLLDQCTAEAKALRLDTPQKRITTPSENAGAASSSVGAILDLAGTKKGSDIPSLRKGQDRQVTKATAKTISETAQMIMRHKNVFITPKILTAAVELQVDLGRPGTLPEAFDLYASKPVPIKGSSPVRYSEPNLDNPNNAIPLKLAQTALDSAIRIRDLPAAISLIQTSYGTTAFQRNRLLRKAGLPIAGLALSPIAIYVLATRLANFAAFETFYLTTGQAFVGFLAYIGFTASLGFVAISTANDQMERVSWAIGMPLRERWMREEERAAYDKVACAWGFKQSSRRGEEDSKEWEELREYLGRRGMVLDRPELMDGME